MVSVVLMAERVLLSKTCSYRTPPERFVKILEEIESLEFPYPRIRTGGAYSLFVALLGKAELLRRQGVHQAFFRAKQREGV